MSQPEVMLSSLTRREAREAFAAGKFRAAIVPTGSNEQHLEHLAMEFDIAAATHVAREAALRLYPQAIVNVPMAVGISEHHMKHKGTVTAKPGSWLTLLFDAVESLVRHGIRNVLILNGHGGNEGPVYGILRQWQLFFQSADPEVNVQFHSYWNLSREIAEQHCETRVPGHAGEYETAMALAVFPEFVRHDAWQEQNETTPIQATAEQGKILIEAAISKTAEFVQGMLDGENRDMQPSLFSYEMLEQMKKK
ncbi:MAG: creatininase family protein [Candidatus Latescibacteria bacterium]|nr:creatininase family protein [Candidatus Latescibacterota bacterium]